jgi:hypothetical protein
MGAPLPDRSIGDWLNTAGFEAAGRVASRSPDSLALVAISDVRRALAWVCGRSASPVACAISSEAAHVPLRIARPFQFPDSTGGPNTGWR